ncbi:MAG: hypothetical protein AB2805_08985 [Candidatus Thiodiazotropha sp.]
MKVKTTPELPSEQEIIDRIDQKDDRYNGYRDLIDAFLALIPEQLKVPENDGRIERLYINVKRAIRSPSMSIYRDSQPYWALVG